MNKKGFTLVEIMIVVAIIALLAAIAIPNLLRARLAANESGAISTLKSIGTVCETYRSSLTAPSYPAGLTDLVNATPPFISGFTNVNEKSGYAFSVDGATNQYTVSASPVTTGVTGNRFFCVDATGVVRAGTAAITTTGDACNTAAAILQ